MITPRQMGAHGWMAVRALPYLGANAKDEMRGGMPRLIANRMAGLTINYDDVVGYAGQLYPMAFVRSLQSVWAP
jgi:hypothetical protein